MNKRTIIFTPSKCPLLVFFVIFLPFTNSTSFARHIIPTEEEQAFNNESDMLDNNLVAELYFGIHGELILPKYPYSGKEGVGCVKVLKNELYGYDLVIYDYPKRYYFGKLLKSGDIKYNMDDLPQVIQKSSFAGPIKWVLYKNGIIFEPQDNDVIMSDTSLISNDKIYNNIKAVFYGCADNSFYISNSTKILSKYAFLLIKNKNSSSLELISAYKGDEPYLTIDYGDNQLWRIFFLRNVDGTNIIDGESFFWPFFDSNNSVEMPNYPIHFYINRQIPYNSPQRFRSDGHPIPIIPVPIP